MKFLSFTVVDPLDFGLKSYPYFSVELDEVIDPWRTSRYGSFVIERAGAFFRFIEVPTDLQLNLAEFNALPSDLHSPRLTEVQVREPWGSTISGTRSTRIMLDVKRAEQLMRRFQLTKYWELKVDELQSREHGHILWRPAPFEHTSQCAHWIKGITEPGKRCHLLGYKGYTIPDDGSQSLERNIKVWYCAKHAREHDAHAITRRTSA